MEKIDFTQFDIMGIFNLKDVAGLENYVSPTSKNDYLSRSINYYKPQSYTALSKSREYLRSLLTDEPSKRNFVILENMLNCSAKMYYPALIKHILSSQESDKYNKIKKCFEEDVSNIINILSGEPIVKPFDKLPFGKDMSVDRAIELDNKMLLYIFTKNIQIPANSHIITPGYGSLYIGPFCKAIHKTEYSNFLKSTYIKDENELKVLLKKDDAFDLVSNPESLRQSKKIILLDDNIGTGQTIKDIKEKFQEKSVDFSCGAVQYNWINYYRFFLGEKEQIFDPKHFDFMTPFNYPGHNLLEHAIENLEKSGDDYIDYLQSKSYRNKYVNDFVGSVARSEYYTEILGFDLYNDIRLNENGKKSNITMKDVVFNLSCINSSNKSVVVKVVQKETLADNYEG